MGPSSASSPAKTLREHLRRATANSHDRLDASMRPASDWQSLEDYTRFLKSQHSARVPVECWLSIHAPCDLKPPEQTQLLARDLIALGGTIPRSDREFELDYRSDATAIGVAWVLAGSSLGNRAMLHDMTKALPAGTKRPIEFLSSSAMTQFWKDLRARLEAPVEKIEAQEAARAAICVFDHFLALPGPDCRGADLETAA